MYPVIHPAPYDYEYLSQLVNRAAPNYSLTPASPDLINEPSENEAAANYSPTPASPDLSPTDGKKAPKRRTNKTKGQQPKQYETFPLDEESYLVKL